MKKIYTLLPVLFLTACVQTGEEYQQDDFYYEDTYHDESAYLSQEEYAFEDDSLMIDEYTGLVVEETPAVIENSQQNMQPVVQSEPAPAVEEKTQETISVSEGGTVITIPEQRIYIGQNGMADVVVPNTEIVVTENAQQHQPALVEEKVLEPQYQAKVVWITFQDKQHPNTYVQCLSNDRACITLHEQQGYIRVQNLPHFAGFYDVLGSSDYPGEGQWRNGNNIPRW